VFAHVKAKKPTEEEEKAKKAREDARREKL